MPLRHARDVTPREEMTAEDTVQQYLPEDTVDYNIEQYRPELRQV